MKKGKRPKVLNQRTCRLKNVLRILLLVWLPLVTITGYASSQGFAYLMTSSNSSNEATLHIISNAEDPMVLTGTLYNSNGEQLGPADQVLSVEPLVPQARLVLTSKSLESIFGVGPWTGPAILSVRSKFGVFELMIKLRSPSGLTSNVNCVTEDSVHNLEASESVPTYIRFINTGTEVIEEIRGSIYNSDGTLIGLPNSLVIQRLEPMQAVWLNRQQLTANVGEDWTNTASLYLTESHENLKLYNLNFDQGTFFNYSCPDSDVYLQTTSRSNNRTETHLINGSPDPVFFTGSLITSDGQVQGQENLRLSAEPVLGYGRLILDSEDIEELFQIEPWTGPAYFQVNRETEANQVFSGDWYRMSKLRSPSGAASVTNCRRRHNVRNIEGFDSPNRSFVRLTRESPSGQDTVTATLFSSTGEVLGEANTEITTLPERWSSVWLSREDLAEIFATEWNGEASLVIDENGNLITLMNLNLINGDTFFNFSCFEESKDPLDDPETITPTPQQLRQFAAALYLALNQAIREADNNAASFDESGVPSFDRLNGEIEENCDNGGSLRTTIESDGASITDTYRNCAIDGVVRSGVTRFDYYLDSLGKPIYRRTYQDYQVETPTFSYRYSGTYYLETDLIAEEPRSAQLSNDLYLSSDAGSGLNWRMDYGIFFARTIGSTNISHFRTSGNLTIEGVGSVFAPGSNGFTAYSENGLFSAYLTHEGVHYGSSLSNDDFDFNSLIDEVDSEFSLMDIPNSDAVTGTDLELDLRSFITDPDLDPVSITLEIINKPESADVSLSNSMWAQFVFQASVAGSYNLQLTATSLNELTKSTEFTVTVVDP